MSVHSELVLFLIPSSSIIINWPHSNQRLIYYSISPMSPPSMFGASASSEIKSHFYPSTYLLLAFLHSIFIDPNQLCGNRLTTIPPEIARLSNLTSLNVRPIAVAKKMNIFFFFYVFIPDFFLIHVRWVWMPWLLFRRSFVSVRSSKQSSSACPSAERRISPCIYW